MKTAVIYARYSSASQTEQSIEGQLHVCNQYAKANDLIVVDTYIDRATTGTNDNRAAFQQMLKDSETSVWDVVLVYAIDRFGRNSIEVAINKQRLKSNKKVLISATQRTSENLDGTKNLDGILLENVYIGIAEYYSAELSQKIRRGNLENRKKGLYTGGILPMGYRAINKKVVIEEDEARVVRFIYEQYAAGEIVRDITERLQAQGISFHGKPFLLNTVYHILRLEKYTGICRYSGTVYTDIFPAIIPKALYDKVQEMLRYNKKGSRSVVTEYLLRQKLLCGLCGTNMQGEAGTSRNGTVMHYYKCMRRKREGTCTKSILPKEKFEQFVIGIVCQLFGDRATTDKIADEIMRIHERRMSDQSVLQLLERDREEVTRSLANIMKAIERGIFNETTKTRMDELEQRRSEIDDKIAIEQCKHQNRLTKDKVISYLTDPLRQAPRRLIRALIEKIIVFDDKIQIFFKYTKTSPADTPWEMPAYPGSDSSNMVERNDRKSNNKFNQPFSLRIRIMSTKTLPLAFTNFIGTAFPISKAAFVKLSPKI